MFNINMKNNLKKNIKIISIALVAALGYSLFASAWSIPTGYPPYSNKSNPINSLNSDQYKYANLSIFDDTTTAAIEGSLVADRFEIFGSDFGPSVFFDAVNIGHPAITTSLDASLYIKENASMSVTSLDEGVLGVNTDGVMVTRPNEVGDPVFYSAGSTMTVVYKDFDTNNPYMVCPVDYPYIIGGGGYCTGDGLTSEKIQKSIPDSLGGNVDGIDHLEYTNWGFGCKGIGDNGRIYAICSK